MLEDLLELCKMFVEDTKVNRNTTIGEICEPTFGHVDFLAALLVLESIHSINVPDEFVERKEMSMEELVAELRPLPKTTDRSWIASRFQLFEELRVGKAMTASGSTTN